MLQVLKNLLQKVLGPKMASQVKLPPHVKLAADTGPNTMSFNLNIGFDIGIDDQGKESLINVKKLLFTSNGDRSKYFIETAEGQLLRETICLLAVAASVHMSSAPDNAFERSTIQSSIPMDTNVDPKLLN